MRGAQRAIGVMLLATSGAVLAAPLAPATKQSFLFAPPGEPGAKPLAVFYYKPAHADARSRVLVAIHGVERDGSRARDVWVKAAEKYNVIVLAPEFDADTYPTAQFQYGGVEQADPARWTFQIVDALFDKVRRDEGLQATSYSLFGHSAGAQFVHRFMLMMERTQVDAAVAANAGTYTFPVYPKMASKQRFPWVLEESRVSHAALGQRFGRKLTILLGQEDTVTNSPDFPNSPAAMLQGATRYERGHNFFDAARAQAQRMEAVFGWRVQDVPGVGHNSARMAAAAAPLLFGAPAVAAADRGTAAQSSAP
ncbi:MAG: hypothetical protein ABIT83_25620 [Massilia sp.]